MRGEVLFFFDLEVVPREATLEEIEELGKGTAPSNYRDPDKIARYESHKAEELYRAWAFDPLNCEIVCCSYAIGTLETTKHGEVLFDAGMVRTLRIDQHDIIADLDRIAEGLLRETQRRIKVIAHNVKGYDAPVLMAAALRSGSTNLVQLLRFEKPWESNLWDTLEWWRTHCSTGGRRSSAKLDSIGRFLGVGSKMQGMDGSKVFDEYRDGNLDLIVEYCEEDVRLLARVYERLLIAI